MTITSFVLDNLLHPFSWLTLSKPVQKFRMFLPSQAVKEGSEDRGGVPEQALLYHQLVVQDNLK